MDEMLKEIYGHAIANELSEEEFVAVFKESLANMGIIRNSHKDELFDRCFAKVKTILNVTDEELKINVRKRYKKYVITRQWKMFLYKRLSNHSFEVAGNMVGKDHATAIYATREICNYRHYDKFFQIQFKEVIEELEKENPYIFNYE